MTNLQRGDVTAFPTHAGGTFCVDKQATLVASVLASTFDVGKNVPAIAYQTGIRKGEDGSCLPGTPCASGNNSDPGVMSDISIERR